MSRQPGTPFFLRGYFAPLWAGVFAVSAAAQYKDKPEDPWDKQILLSPTVAYGYTWIYGEPQVPQFYGYRVGGGLRYRVGGNVYSLAPGIQAYWGKLSNSANGPSLKETLEVLSWGPSLTLYAKPWNLDVAWMHYDLLDTSLASSLSASRYRHAGPKVAVNYEWMLSKFVDVSAGAYVYYASYLAATVLGTDRKENHLEMGLALSMDIALPSYPSAEPETLKKGDRHL